MTKQMQRDLDRLQALVLQMAGCVEGAVYRGVKALRERDGALAREVLAGDNEIDALENAVQEEALSILALHHPVAGDLRRIAAVLFISTDLERMGDLASDIAERALALYVPPFFPIPEKLAPMAATAAAMVRQSLDAFVQTDAAAARGVVLLDDTVDAYHRQIIEAITAEMKRNVNHIEAGISMFSAIRHLERIADHATNIAEGVIYLVEGQIVRHHPEARAMPSSN